MPGKTFCSVTFLERRGYSHVDIISMMQGTNVDPLSLDVAAANEQASVPRQRFPRTCSVSWSVVRKLSHILSSFMQRLFKERLQGSDS